ncbi:NIPSNAP family protein [Terriglobus aquaticus]|uniref:NIPSNAP family protein n=1 Tax=Terriglobus aquaticus TaxID=940139 RepID=A0ABW9KLX9_9BACT|nr:NIPSNAP family protein [Terriglobus aquaticus]
MERREFLGAAAGAATLGLWSNTTEAEGSMQANPQSSEREFYLLRKYSITRAQAAGCDRFLETVMLPALTRLGHRDVGVFGLEYGPETPADYLLLRHTNAAKLLKLQEELTADAEFARAAGPFQSAAAATPSFQRVEDTLLYAFAGHPVLTVPAKGKRILQLRTYESPSVADHVRKVQMFHSGEFEIFAACGMPAVFYSQVVVGPRMPALTYMLRFDSLSDLEARWNQFRVNPDWKKLQADPRFSGEDLVSNISNLVLSPKSFSAI